MTFLDYLYTFLGKIQNKYLLRGIILRRYVNVLQLIRTKKVADADFKLVRVGSKGDGGYVVPQNVFFAFDRLVSFGIGSNNDFEFDLSTKLVIYQFDHTILIPPNSNANMFFEKKGVGTTTGTNRVSLDFVLSKFDNLERVILKLDVEGAEFESLLASKLWKNVGLFIIEFHGVEKFIVGREAKKNQNLLEDLKENFINLHIHGNNCCGFFEAPQWRVPKLMELTLINKRLVKNKEITDNHSKYPIEIDYPNLKDLPDLYIGDLYDLKGIGFS
jgi:hypothetical protein